jgi:TonB family protein
MPRVEPPMRNILLISMMLAAGNLSAAVKTHLPKTNAHFPVIQTEKKLPNKLLLPGDKFYPEAFAKIGLQGEVKFQLELSPLGKIMTIKILSSSKSPALDEKASAFIKDPEWKLPDNFPNQVPRVYTLKLIFLKDSPEQIDKKTCADFNVDLKYFRSVNPNAEISKVGAFDVISNLFTVSLMKTQGGDKALSYVRARNKIAEQTAQACATQPNDLLLKTYVKFAKKNGVVF